MRKTMAKKKTAKELNPEWKQHLGAKITGSLVEAIRNACWHVGKGWSLNKILEDGAIRELARLEKENGGPFPEREQDLERPKGIKAPRGQGPRPTISWRMYIEDQERLRNAAAALGLTVTSIVEAGATKVLEELQTQHNKGKPFKQREGDLPGASPRQES